MFSGVGTAYRSLKRAYREEFFEKLISVHCTFNIRDLRVRFKESFSKKKVNENLVKRNDVHDYLVHLILDHLFLAFLVLT